MGVLGPEAAVAPSCLCPRVRHGLRMQYRLSRQPGVSLALRELTALRDQVRGHRREKGWRTKTLTGTDRTQRWAGRASSEVIETSCSLGCEGPCPGRGHRGDGVVQAVVSVSCGRGGAWRWGFAAGGVAWQVAWVAMQGEGREWQAGPADSGCCPSSCPGVWQASLQCSRVS